MKIVIVDDDAIVAMSLQTILLASGKLEVAALGNDGTDAVKLYEEHRPDIILMDIQMKTMSGLDAAKEILSRHPEAKIIFLTTFMDDEYVKTAILSGAKGYILKQDFESVVPSIEAVYSGQTVFGNEVISRMPEYIEQHNIKTYEKYGITEKEFEVIKLVADGLSNKEIASQLCLSDGTVRNYVSTVLEKLELRDRTQLAVFYYKH